MQTWINFIVENFGSVEDFNKLPYAIKYDAWEEFMKEQ